MNRYHGISGLNGLPTSRTGGSLSISPNRSRLATRQRNKLLVKLAIIGSTFALFILVFLPSVRSALLSVFSLGLLSSVEELQLETVRYYDLSNHGGTARGWEKEERVLLCAPLRDAESHLPMFFAHLRNFTYPHHLIDLAFLVSDSKDRTLSLLSQMLNDLQNDPDPKQPYGEISILEKDFGQKVNQDVESRHGFAAQASRRKLMAQARNWLLSAALRPTHSWVYWRDVDVETAPFTILEDLMRHNKDVIVPNVWRPLPDWLGGEQPYDLNSWQESETALALADTLDEDAVIVEGYAEYATWRPHLAYLRDPYGDPDMEMEIDGVGGVSILAKARVFRSGVHFPAFSFEKHAETEGFGKMSKRMGFSVVGLPHYTVWHLYEPSVDDIRHMEEMENERKNREREEKERAERAKKIKEEFNDPGSQWEKDKSSMEGISKKEEENKAREGSDQGPNAKAHKDNAAAGVPKEEAKVPAKDKVDDKQVDSKGEKVDSKPAKKQEGASFRAKRAVTLPQRISGSEANMASLDAQQPATGTVQQYPVQSDHEGPSQYIDPARNYDRLIAAQYVRHTHNGQSDRVEVNNGLPHERRTLSVAVDAVALITTECITVTSAMRKHARWAHSSVSAILGGSPAFSRPSGKSSHLTSKGRPEPQSDMGSVGYGSGAGDNLLASRWGLRGKKGRSMQDDPLLAAFARLRNDLRGCTDIRTFDIPALLHPFLQVIRSSSTSASITSLALVAITKFFTYDLISGDSPRLALGMQLLSAAITHCRFEASDSAADETVLLQILKLMEGILSGPGGDLLGDESVCEMMETGLSMCCQVRLSALLRRSAEMSMSSMCQVVFERLKTLEVEAGDKIGAMDAESQESPNPLKLKPSVNGDSVMPISDEGEQKPTSKVDGKDATYTNADESHVSTSLDLPRNNGESVSQRASASAIELSQPAGESMEEVVPIKPYGLPSIRELFRVLVDLLQPHSKQHGDGMKVMALRIIDIALEVAGPSIARHPSLAMLAKDDLCRHLFQLVRSENMTLLNGSLRVAGTLLHTCRGVLKLQQELFLSYLVACLHPRVEIPPEPGIDPALYEGIPEAPKLVRPATSSNNSGRSTPVPVKDRQKLGMEGGLRKPDAREAMVENIGALSRIPSYLVELFVNYDCEVDRADLCEDLIGLLARNAFPDAATWSTTNVPALCLDALLGYVQFIADRLDSKPKLVGYPDQRKLQEQRARKKIVIRGASRFNEHPKSGIAFLASQGIIDDPDNVHSVARFLRGTTRISKTVLGEFLSKKAHDQLLKAFMDLFDFNGKRVDEALRELLNSFRLPGEAPLIERIVEVFSEKYCSGATPEGIAGKDAVHVLAYAIIILNTDQHNPSVKDEKRMKQADFAKNLRGVNGGGDFDPDYLQQIYDSIRNNEIILPEEHSTARAFDYAWEELLLKTKDAGDLVLCDTNIFDADMFQATWKPIVATLSYVFMSASEDVVFPRINTGFLQCAQIAARYGVTEALDRIVYCLSSMSTIALDRPWSTSLNTKVQRGKDSVMVSELAVKLGGNFRAKLATYVLFHNVVRGNVTEIRTGWKYIVQMWLNLFANSLVSPSLSRRLYLEPIPLSTPTHVVDRADKPADGGFIQSFFSTISSYTADDPPEPSEEELEYALMTVDCITNCHIEELLAAATQMPPRATKDLTLALLEQLPQDSCPVVIVVKPERPAAPPRVNGQRQGNRGPAYDPSLLYILELITVLAIRDDANFAAVGELVADAIQNIVRNAANVHSMVLARAVFYLLLLLQKSADQSFVRAPVVLHMISSFSQPKLERAAALVLKGFSICIKESGSLRNEIINTPDFWSTIERIHAIPAVSANVFALLTAVIEDRALAVTADNYEFVISLLNSFANAGGAAAASQQHQQREANGRRQRSQEENLPKDSEEIQRGQEAVYLVYQLTNRVPTLIEQSHLERNEAWITYWSPIFSCLRMQCENPHRVIRRRAFSCLQGALQSAELASTDHQEWTAIFAEVLFPLMDRLLKPEVYQADPAGMSETRVAVAKLLCKIFLHYLVTLAEWDGMLDTWYKILELLERLMGSGQGHGMEEEISESLKNILYFMKSDGYLIPPSTAEGKKDDNNIWHETWKRVDRFLPGMRKEIFSESPPQQKARPRQSTEKESEKAPVVAEETRHANA
ncbi:MAG: hypothetical protein Q9209_007510 [Squamulea sp. 1 TL-2023]